MRSKLGHFFIVSAGVLLMITAGAKFISGMGNSRILDLEDPLLPIRLRHLLFIVGGIEGGTSVVCFFSTRKVLQVGLLAWLSTSFGLYHLGLLWIGYEKQCPCLGSLADALHVSARTAEFSMKLILSYLLVGSYAALFELWRTGRKPSASTTLTETDG
jgi:hypothetical protein